MEAPTDVTMSVCSITSTKRRRFFWAAWWTGPPAEHPFRKPDASHGGAASREEARSEAERAAGRALADVEPHWARAWMRILRGQPPWTPRDRAPSARRSAPREPPAGQGATPWTLLGLQPGATPADIKRAFRKRALETHPDRGGDAAVFRAVRHAYERLLVRATRAGRKPRRAGER